ncbi:MAG: aldo/keto reductase [Bilophila wadsworthia]
MYPALEEAYRAGRLKAIGVSNFNASRCEAFLRACTVIPAVQSGRAHIFFQQRGLLEEMKKHGTHMQAWSPLPPGKTISSAIPYSVPSVSPTTRLRRRYALKYLVQLGISVIPKSSHRERMRKTSASSIFSCQTRTCSGYALDGKNPVRLVLSERKTYPSPHQAIRRPHAPTRFPQISGRSGAFHRRCRARVPAPASG